VFPALGRSPDASVYIGEGFVADWLGGDGVHGRGVYHARPSDARFDSRTDGTLI
jgi:hypothetical protein